MPTHEQWPRYEHARCRSNGARDAGVPWGFSRGVVAKVNVLPARPGVLLVKAPIAILVGLVMLLLRLQLPNLLLRSRYVVGVFTGVRPLRHLRSIHAGALFLFFKTNIYLLSPTVISRHNTALKAVVSPA